MTVEQSAIREVAFRVRLAAELIGDAKTAGCEWPSDPEITKLANIGKRLLGQLAEVARVCAQGYAEALQEEERPRASGQECLSLEGMIERLIRECSLTIEEFTPNSLKREPPDNREHGGREG